MILRISLLTLIAAFIYPSEAQWQQSLDLSSFNPSTAVADPRCPICPPCSGQFDCSTDALGCINNGTCLTANGSCNCAEGFGGEQCSEPLCGSPVEGQNRKIRDGPDCACDEGWSGINCNVCETDAACSPLLGGGDDDLPSAFSSQSSSNGAVCYKGGYAVKRIHQMCDVTNRKILDMLPDRKPQVTFSCDRASDTCAFQFWIGQVESFFCDLQSCDVKAIATPNANRTEYKCESMQCSCIPDRMLCGESGSVDIGEFLSEEIKGPGKFSCATDGRNCKFEEPAMNNLINDIFGDTYITLMCDAGECMHYSQVPGFVAPPAPDNSKLVALSIAMAGLVVVAASLLFWYLGRTQKSKRGPIRLPSDDLLTSAPAPLQFSTISYSLNGKQILSDVSGSIGAGQIMAIVGSSGAGKSTFLDILARKNKRGTVSGETRVGGRKVSNAEYKRLIGFVDQEDTLMSTLTVYETVLYSALLRLPREMEFEAKRARVLETLDELGILGIRDSRIGESGKRSISGGEKRRVSIACELVTSPSILLLDEPTSGLDAYNAHNVVESLVSLAKNYNRTVIFTIHQPRSNIVALFDHLVLLAKGRTVYSGPFAKCQEYFQGIGHPCPAGYNIADFLIDLTSADENKPSDSASLAQASTTDEEAASHHRTTSNQHDIRLKTKTSIIGLDSRSQITVSPPLSEKLQSLVKAYQESTIASDVSQEIIAATSAADQANGHSMSDEIVRYKRASWWTQFRILSGRAFKNLYRNPMLMLSHYAVSVALAIICSFLFSGVTQDIKGFQNRMGLFFFVLALFGFSCLTSLGVFANERMLFMRERANGYYSPFTYFTAKILFDILPLRVVPPFILGAIIYKPVGLVPTVPEFWKFILVLILFNLVTSSVVFFISIIISDGGVANLVGSLVMLFNLLFAGLLINKDKMPRGTGWMQNFSFFHAAYEALLVNEVRYLQLKEHRYGVDIEVPAATILSLFGFHAQAFWWPDVATLLILFGVFTVLSFLALQFFVKERR